MTEILIAVEWIIGMFVSIIVGITSFLWRLYVKLGRFQSAFCIFVRLELALKRKLHPESIAEIDDVQKTVDALLKNNN